MLPYNRRTPLDLDADTALQLVARHGVVRPSPAVCFKIADHRLNPVNRLGKDRVIAFGGFELIPQRPERPGLIRRQQPEDPVCRPLLDGFGQRRIMGSVDRRVACINFNQIMDQKHPDDPGDIDGPIGMLGQRDGIECNMPAMLG